MLPLEGIVVADLTSVVAGPLATSILAEQGARVVKVEPRTGDRVRMLGPVAAPGRSAVHARLNAGKESVVLDLTESGDVETLLRIVAAADVLVHNYRPGVMERLGLTLDRLREARADIIVARITGFGQTGPLSDQRAYDPIIQAEAGLTVPDASGEPRLIPQYVCDKVSGLYAAQAITAALLARARGQGAPVIDVSMLEAAVAFGWMDTHQDSVFAVPVRRGPDIATVYRPWPTRDGWLVIVMISDQEFTGFAKAIGAPGLVADERFADMPTRFHHWDAIRAAGEPYLAALSCEEAARRLREAGVPCGIVNSGDALVAHPQLAANDFLKRVGDAVLPAAVARFGEERMHADPAPDLGAHTAKIRDEFREDRPSPTERAKP